MDDKKKLSVREMQHEKRKIKRLLRIRRQELLHLERLLRDVSKEMQTAKAIELQRKRIKEELKAGKAKFSKRALLNILKELNDDDT